MITEEEIILAERALGLALPAVSAWIRSRIAGGSSVTEAAADLEALFAAANASIDIAEDVKFGPEPTTKP